MTDILQINSEELGKLKDAAVNADTWGELTKKQQETVSQQNTELEALSNKVADNKKRQDTAAEKKSTLEKEIAELREKIEAKQQTRGNTVESYALFVRALGEISSESAARSAAFEKGGSYSARDIRFAQLDNAFTFVDGWAEFSETTEKKLSSLEDDGKQFKEEGADVSSVEDARAAFAAAKKAYDASGSTIVREQARRRDKEKSITSLKADQEKLLQWCRQQRSVLEGLNDAESIQEFCTSFQNNIAVMETNFLVLMEEAEDLVPNPEVEKALIDVSEVWLSLEVYCFERLRTTLLEVHEKSNLEGEAKMWADYSIRLSKFLRDAERLLEISDDESVAVTKPVLESCKSLLTDHDAHLIIVEHLADFSLREECIKDHYDAIRRSVLSRLTLLTQSFLGHFTYSRKQEYQDRLAELTDWVDCKSQSDAWKQLLSRVDRMKSLIEENEASHGTDERY